MAENVVLSVQLNGAEAALAQLTQLDQVLNHIKANRNVKITVNARSLNTAAQNAQTLNTNLSQATNTAKTLGTSGEQAGNQAGKALQGASRNAESFNNGLGNVVLTMAKFRLASSAINAVGTAFKDAWQEMKRVDSEMVNIRKVTGFASDELNRLSKNSFTLAGKYGRSASDVLTGETVFARAGYTTQIEQLGELSLLLQNVGDLQADDAAKFVIATDKAYKLGGSYDDLMKVIDGLDNITNRNATDMQKMTEGMTVAGSVFAESGESIETFAALLGTATANTQRSGAEMARGLRTILMNLRQIRGETEDGELIDGESIAAAAKALKDYAGISTMENGQLRKASDVLEELAGKWDTLSETQKAAISEAVAGKRQANILMTLMGDWESVEKMRQEYVDSAGTAIEENLIFLDSYEAKLAQIQAKQNELINGLANSDAVKSGMDFILDVQDMLLGTQMGDAPDLSAQYEKNLQDLLTIGKQYDELKNSAKGLTWAEEEELKILEAQKRELEAQLGITLEQARAGGPESTLDGLSPEDLEARYNALNKRLDLANQLKALQDAFSDNGDTAALYKGLTSIVDKYKEFYDAVEKRRKSGATLTSDEIAFARAYETSAKAISETETSLEAYGYAVAASSLATGESAENSAQKANEAMSILAQTIDDLPSKKTIEIDVVGKFSFAAGMSVVKGAAGMFDGKYRSPIGNLINNIGTNILGLASGTNSAPGGPTLVNENGPEMISANGLAWIAGGGEPTVTMLPKGATVLTAEETKRATGGRRYASIRAYGEGTKTCPNCGNHVSSGVRHCPYCNYDFWGGQVGYVPSRHETGSSFYVTGDPGYDFVSGSAPQNNTSASAGPGNASNAFRFINVGDLSDYSGSGSSHGTESKNYVISGKTGKKYETKICPVCGTPNDINAKRCVACGYQFYGGGDWSGGSSGPAAPNFAALEDELAKLLKNLDAQAELAENEEDYIKAMMVYGEAQAAIADLLEQYRANGYADDSDEVLRLANLGYDYAAKQLGGYDKLQEKLIEALNALTDSTDKANELQERREAVEKAREALANAEKQRTVRIFNPVTGQWEWVANAADVQKAQENLKNAEEALKKEEFSQAVDAIKNAKPGDLGDMALSPAILEALFGGTPEQQSAFLNALGAATGGADYLGSAEAQTAWNQGTSIGTQYNLAGITLTETQASGMTIKELIAMLQGLKVM